jgi:Methyltransferase domain
MPKHRTESKTKKSKTMSDNERNCALPGQMSGIELTYPDRLLYPIHLYPTAWLGHIPFAFWIVQAIRPRVLVELGVHSGNSYCAFLQAVRMLGIDCKCFGIDHWRGEEHAGEYEDDVYAELADYHDQRYAAFSTLVRSTFDGALVSFSDGTIDLLHIDGFHTYEAVARDFDQWLPKMSSRGVVIFHDTNVRQPSFGVWRFWEEISVRFRSFEFVHSNGLGVAYVGTEPASGLLGAMLTADAPVKSQLRAYFGRLGKSVLDRYHTATRDAQTAQLTARTAHLTARNEALEMEISTILAQTAKTDRPAWLALLSGKR